MPNYETFDEWDENIQREQPHFEKPFSCPHLRIITEHTTVGIYHLAFYVQGGEDNLPKPLQLERGDLYCTATTKDNPSQWRCNPTDKGIRINRAGNLESICKHDKKLLVQIETKR